jgi:DNA-binding transcriptional MerR regulator
VKKTIEDIREKYGPAPSTIRNWEALGLIEFQRDWCGRRIFDDPAIERIKELMDRRHHKLSGAGDHAA